MTVSHEGQLGGRMVQAALNETLVTNPGYSYTWRVHIQPTTWICAAHTSQVNPVDDDTEASLSSQCSRDDLYSYTSKLPSPVILCSFLCHGKTHFILFESWSLPLNVHHLWLYSLFPCARACVCVCVWFQTFVYGELMIDLWSLCSFDELSVCGGLQPKRQCHWESRLINCWLQLFV